MQAVQHCLKPWGTLPFRDSNVIHQLRDLALALEQSHKYARTHVGVRCQRARVQTMLRILSPMILQLNGTLDQGTRAYPRTGRWEYANLPFPLW